MFAAVAVEVQVALITAGSAVVVALGTGVLAVLNKRSAARVEDKIGTPNGQGNVVQMLERILAGQAGQDNRIANLEGGQHNLREQHAETKQDVARLAGRVDVLERRGAL